MDKYFRAYRFTMRRWMQYLKSVVLHRLLILQIIVRRNSMIHPMGSIRNSGLFTRRWTERLPITLIKSLIHFVWDRSKYNIGSIGMKYLCMILSCFSGQRTYRRYSKGIKSSVRWRFIWNQLEVIFLCDKYSNYFF